MKWKAAALLIAVIMALASGPGACAEGVETHPEIPPVPGAEELRMFLPYGVVCRRANVFSQGEAIACEAEWNGETLTLFLLRPLAVGEQVRVLLAGEDGTGSAYSFDHTYEITFYSAFREAAGDVMERIGRIGRSQSETELEALKELLPRLALLLSPGVSYDPAAHSVRVLDASSAWEVLILPENGMNIICAYSPDAAAYLPVPNYMPGLVTEWETVRTIQVTAKFYFGNTILHGYFMYSAEKNVGMQEMHLYFMNTNNYYAGIENFAWMGCREGDGMSCAISLSCASEPIIKCEYDWIDGRIIP